MSSINANKTTLTSSPKLDEISKVFNKIVKPYKSQAQTPRGILMIKI